MPEARLGTLSATSIGIGGMVGGGIFAVTGLTVNLTRGAAPLAFVVAGVVALLTAYSYWRLSLRFPSRGGTVEFLNRAFGAGIGMGSLNILLCLSYVILLSVYAYAFGAYGAGLLPGDGTVWKHVLISAVIVGLAVVNYVGADVAIRSENAFNLVKLVLLLVFVVVGLCRPIEWSRLSTDQWVEPMALMAGAMVIFLNYEGFELIANASNNLANPRRALPVAYLGGVLTVIVLYALIAVVVVGHLPFSTVARSPDDALATAATAFMGPAGRVMIVVAAVLATSSAINATFYGAGRLTYLIAKSGELPAELERSIRDQPLEGMLIFAGLTLLIANVVPLDAIATMGSAGFLLIFLAVNAANVRLARETSSAAWISALGVLACAMAVGALLWSTLADPATAWQAFILVGMALGSLLIEIVYRALTGRAIVLPHLARHRVSTARR